MLITMSMMNYNAPENKGKGIDEVGERQKRRIKLAIRESSKKASWFVDSFIVDLSTIILKLKSSDYKITLTYSNDFESDPSLQTVGTITTFPELLPCSEIEVLFLLEYKMSFTTNCQ